MSLHSKAKVKHSYLGAPLNVPSAACAKRFRSCKTSKFTAGEVCRSCAWLLWESTQFTSCGQHKGMQRAASDGADTFVCRMTHLKTSADHPPCAGNKQPPTRKQPRSSTSQALYRQHRLNSGDSDVGCYLEARRPFMSQGTSTGHAGAVASSSLEFDSHCCRRQWQLQQPASGGLSGCACSAGEYVSKQPSRLCRSSLR